MQKANRPSITKRTAQLTAVAALPVIVGLSGAQFRDPVALLSGFHEAMLVTAGLALAGALLAWFGISDDVLAEGTAEERPAAQTHCAVAGTPLQATRPPAEPPRVGAR